MSFEVKEHDLAGRVGKLRTKSGVVETPALFPVINPKIQPIPPREMKEKFKISAVITNAYILMKNFGDTVIERGIHDFLDFDGVVMTDSGAYQLLIYGGVDTTPYEVVKFQEEIGSDIATILDVPTGWNVSRKKAEETVETTITRAEELFRYKTREDILWVGPIQGGLHFDLVKESAKKMAELPFEIYALGSPTGVMEKYLFTDLVDMIVSARSQIPESRPFHLFGAGHPFMLALAVALGCDLFDSAAYAIFAREDRYMTDWGTVRLSNLEWLPCSCPICMRNEPSDLLELSKDERFEALSRHNLYRCVAEIQRIKQSIREGRLWEHLEVRARGHPSLLSALKNLKRYVEYLEKRSPVTKRRGIFFFDSSGLVRPEVHRHAERLFKRFHPQEEKRVLILIPKDSSRSSSREYRRLRKSASKILGDKAGEIHVCFYDVPFGVIPIELDQNYPLTQYVAAKSPDFETIDFVSKIVRRYILESRYEAAFLVEGENKFGEKISKVFKSICESKGIHYNIFRASDFRRRDALEKIMEEINETLKKNDSKNDIKHCLEA